MRKQPIDMEDIENTQVFNIQDYGWDLHILSFAFGWDNRRNEHIVCTATGFDKKHKPNKWAIRRGSSVMNKKTGQFEYEPLPSSRTDKWLKDHRFNNYTSAFNCFAAFYNKKNDTNQN